MFQVLARSLQCRRLVDLRTVPTLAGPALPDMARVLSIQTEDQASRVVPRNSTDNSALLCYVPSAKYSFVATRLQWNLSSQDTNGAE